MLLQPTLTKTVDRQQELVLARANAITNQAYVISPNYGGLFGTGGSIVVDPEGHVLVQGGSGEEFLTQMIDLDRVTATREYGTAGLSRLWKQLRDVPPPAFPQYRDGFAAGEVMRGLGPLKGVQPSRQRTRPRFQLPPRRSPPQPVIAAGAPNAVGYRGLIRPHRECGRRASPAQTR